MEQQSLLQKLFLINLVSFFMVLSDGYTCYSAIQNFEYQISDRTSHVPVIAPALCCYCLAVEIGNVAVFLRMKYL